MRFGRTTHAERTLPVDITPMIDVVFLLIIFFMVTAQFARITRAELDLPRQQGEQDQAAEEAGLVINLLANGGLIVNERDVTLAELLEVVREEIVSQPDRDPRQVKLLIRADRNGDTALLNEVLTSLQELGVGTARLATEVPR